MAQKRKTTKKKSTARKSPNKKNNKNETPTGLLICVTLVGLIIIGASFEGKKDDVKVSPTGKVLSDVEKKDGTESVKNSEYAPKPTSKTTTAVSNSEENVTTNESVTSSEKADGTVIITLSETASETEATTTTTAPEPRKIVIPDIPMPKHLSQSVDSFPADVDWNSHEDVAENDVPEVLQMPDLPTGCEITALTALLKYHGYNVSKITMAKNFLPIEPAGESDFNNAFIGNPYNYTGFGCFSPVIKYSAERFLNAQGSDLDVYNLTGTDFYKLLALVSDGSPVLCWVSGNLKPLVDKGSLWLYEEREVTWKENEHCMVLTGYDHDKGLVYVMDPLKGNVSYDIDLFQQRYEEMGEMSVVIR